MKYVVYCHLSHCMKKKHDFDSLKTISVCEISLPSTVSPSFILLCPLWLMIAYSVRCSCFTLEFRDVCFFSSIFLCYFILSWISYGKTTFCPMNASPHKSVGDEFWNMQVNKTYWPLTIKKKQRIVAMINCRFSFLFCTSLRCKVFDGFVAKRHGESSF